MPAPPPRPVKAETADDPVTKKARSPACEADGGVGMSAVKSPPTVKQEDKHEPEQANKALKRLRPFVEEPSQTVATKAKPIGAVPAKPKPSVKVEPPPVTKGVPMPVPSRAGLQVHGLPACPTKPTQAGALRALVAKPTATPEPTFEQAVDALLAFRDSKGLITPPETRALLQIGEVSDAERLEAERAFDELRMGTAFSGVDMETVQVQTIFRRGGTETFSPDSLPNKPPPPGVYARTQLDGGLAPVQGVACLAQPVAAMVEEPKANKAEPTVADAPATHMPSNMSGGGAVDTHGSQPATTPLATPPKPTTVLAEAALAVTPVAGASAGGSSVSVKAVHTPPPKAAVPETPSTTAGSEIVVLDSENEGSQGKPATPPQQVPKAEPPATPKVRTVSFADSVPNAGSGQGQHANTAVVSQPQPKAVVSQPKSILKAPQTAVQAPIVPAVQVDPAATWLCSHVMRWAVGLKLRLFLSNRMATMPVKRSM